MREHTPGPWKVDKPDGNNCDGIVTAYDMQVEWSDDPSDGQEPRIIVETDGGHYPPHIADAYLIAGAPEMYEALVKWRHLNVMFDQGFQVSWSEFNDMAERALAKVEESNA